MDKQTIVRILEINIKDYKNIVSGKLKVGSTKNVDDNKIDILGIYGQNGSGKTAVINVMGLVKDILKGKSLPDDINEYITYGKNETEIEIIFYIKKATTKYKVAYNFIIRKEDENSFIKEESLYYWDQNDNNKWNRKKALIINKNNINNLLPLYRNDEIISLYEEQSDFIVSKKINFKNNTSFIFSEEFVSLVTENLNYISNEYEILSILKDYGYSNLFIIDNKQLAVCDANILLPMNFKNYKSNKNISMGVMPIGLESPTYLPREAIDEVEIALISSNKVINEIIPGLNIWLKELSIKTSESGNEEVLVELISCRDNSKIPIRYESNGIKKIVATLHLLIAMFNNSSMTVLVDELDSGIFEYLLGEILEILEERGNGQLIFTSHNLRPLEVLNKNNLIFTTTNPNNRYIKLKNVKTNNNLRDMYYRDIILNGQDEVIYDQTNSAKIARAFRKAAE